MLIAFNDEAFITGDEIWFGSYESYGTCEKPWQISLAFALARQSFSKSHFKSYMKRDPTARFPFGSGAIDHVPNSLRLVSSLSTAPLNKGSNGDSIISFVFAGTWSFLLEYFRFFIAFSKSTWHPDPFMPVS